MVVLSAFCFTDIKGQIHQPVYRELIIELPRMSAEKNLASTVFALVGMGGIQYEGYCSQMKCMLLKADQNVYGDDTSIMNKLKELQLDFIIKPTGKISQVIASCKDPLILNDEQENLYPDK